MRPKLGSAPWSAVFTSGELATARATGSTASGAPAHDDAADPLGALAVAPRSRARAGAAARRAPRRTRSSSGVSGSTATPDAPLAMHEDGVARGELAVHARCGRTSACTQTPVSRSTVSGSSAASVWTKQNMVAKRGEIIPAPLACAASRTAPDGSCTSRQARFGPRSLVRIASREGRRRPARARAQAARTPGQRRSRGSSVPITPVEATPTWSGSTPSASAAAACMAQRGLERRARPSPTLELPELATTARSAAGARLARDDHRRAHARVGGEAGRRHRLGRVARRARPRRARPA